MFVSNFVMECEDLLNFPEGNIFQLPAKGRGGEQRGREGGPEERLLTPSIPPSPIGLEKGRKEVQRGRTLLGQGWAARRGEQRISLPSPRVLLAKPREEWLWLAWKGPNNAILTRIRARMPSSGPSASHRRGLRCKHQAVVRLC